MATTKTVTINGRQYDAATGLLVKTSEAAAHTVTKSVAMHSTMQHARTLNRRAAKKPVPARRPASTTSKATPATAASAASATAAARPTTATATPTTAASASKASARPAPGRHMDIARSPSVSHFAQHPKIKPTADKPLTIKPTAVKVPAKPLGAGSKDRPAQVHPTAQRALRRVQSSKSAPAAVTLTPKQTKDAAIAKALSQPTVKPAKAPKTAQKLKKRPLSRSIRFLIAISIILIVLIGAGVAAYRIFPGISVGIASAQAGINATFPEYTPDGYSLVQPVTYKEGFVTLKFGSNSNDHSYTITQEGKLLDSASLLESIVIPAAGNNYVTTKERGLTIFTYNKTAVWTNGGILYTISGDIQLSNEQIRHIATSL